MNNARLSWRVIAATGPRWRAVILTNLAERLAVPYPSLLAIAGVGLAFLPFAPPKPHLGHQAGGAGSRSALSARNSMNEGRLSITLDFSDRSYRLD
jgi:hypothetical protein